MSSIDRRRGAGTLSKKNLSATTFLGKDDIAAYINSKELLEFVDNARIEDLEELNSFFNLVKQDLKMVINRRTNTDRGGLSYKFENFIRPKGTEGVKVVLLGNIHQFILDYQAGLFSIDFTLDELVEEAERP